MSIAPIQQPASIEGIRSVEPNPRERQVDVGNVFGDALREAQALEKNAVDQSTRFANGDPNVGIHEVMIASEEANIALRFTTTLKNKALDAYRELMSTQV